MKARHTLGGPAGLALGLITTLLGYSSQGCDFPSCDPNLGSRDVVQIFFYSPELLDTYGAVTESNIETSANCRLEIDGNGDAAIELRSMIARARSGSFDGDNVRLKATGLLPLAAVFIDNKGGVRLRGRQVEDRELDEESFRRHRQILDRLAEQRACRIEGRLVH